MKNHDSPLARLSIEEAPKLDLKALPSYFRYVFLWRGGTLHVIIAKDLNVTPVETLVSKRINGASGWTLRTLLGSLSIFFLIKSNSCWITSLVLRIKED